MAFNGTNERNNQQPGRSGPLNLLVGRNIQHQDLRLASQSIILYLKLMKIDIARHTVPFKVGIN
jgi:hypothetical protein